MGRLLPTHNGHKLLEGMEIFQSHDSLFLHLNIHTKILHSDQHMIVCMMSSHHCHIFAMMHYTLDIYRSFDLHDFKFFALAGLKIETYNMFLARKEGYAQCF